MGLELYVPPTPISKPPARTRFVMVDNLNEAFYDIDYETPLLGNTTPWAEVALHTVPDPAIVFPPEQQDMLHKMQFATGFLVSIESRGSVICAQKLGRVNVKQLPKELMNWSALAAKKGKELPAEMRAGLLRHIWNRRSDAAAQSVPFVTPGRVLNDMPRSWQRDGVALNNELDGIFVGGKAIGPPSRWKLSGLDAAQIQKSRERAAVFLE